MFFSVTKGIQSINLGAVAVCWVLAISVSCLGLQRHNLSTVQTDRWQYTENWKHPLTHVFSHQYVMFTVQYSLLVKRVRLLFNSPRKSHSYTRHVKWGSEAAAKGGREGAGWKVIRRVIHTPLLCLMKLCSSWSTEVILLPPDMAATITTFKLTGSAQVNDDNILFSPFWLTLPHLIREGELSGVDKCKSMSRQQTVDIPVVWLKSDLCHHPAQTLPINTTNTRQLTW